MVKVTKRPFKKKVKRLRKKSNETYSSFVAEIRNKEPLDLATAISAVHWGHAMRGSPYLNLAPRDRRVLHARQQSVSSPLTAIQAYCLTCAGGLLDKPAATTAVKECVCTECPLWPFRLGGNPFHNEK